MAAGGVDQRVRRTVGDHVPRAAWHAERARSGQGPTLLEFKTFRMRGHEEASGTDYVPREMFEEWGPRDPLIRFETLLLERQALTAEERDRLKEETRRGPGRFTGRIRIEIEESPGQSAIHDMGEG